MNGNIKTILFSGNNYGLSTILADKIITNFQPDEKLFLDYQNDKKDYSILNDLRSNLQDGFFSSKKLIKVYNIKSKKGIAKEMTFLEDSNWTDKIVLLFGTEIDSKCELKTFFEKGNHVACVNLYEDDEKTAIVVIENFFQQHNIKTEPEAIKTMAELLHGDRLALLCECKKMLYYCQGTLSVNDVLNAIENEQNGDITTLADNILVGNLQKAISEIELLKKDEMQIIMFTRFFVKVIELVLDIKQEVASGVGIDMAIKSKFLFWKRIPTIKLAVSKSTIPFLENQLKIALQTEKMAKKYGNDIASAFFVRNAILYSLR